MKWFSWLKIYCPIFSLQKHIFFELSIKRFKLIISSNNPVDMPLIFFIKTIVFL